MKSHKLFILFLIGFIISSCSRDDNNDNQENVIQNGFEIDNVFFPTNIAYLIKSTDLTIILTNKELLENDIDSGLNFVYLQFTGVDFEIGNETIPDYRIVENASYNGNTSLVENGNTILFDLESGFTANESNLTINNVTSTEIDLTFSFTREDGKIINGTYSGSFSIDN